MRIERILPAAGLAVLASCAGNAPPQVQTIATWNGGLLTPERWSAYKATAIAPGQAVDEPKIFQEYIRTQLDARAAEDLGLTNDSSKARRWNSIEKRIVMDMINREYIGKQGAVPDSQIQAWTAKQPEAVKALPADTLRTRAVRAILLQGTNLDSVYKANQNAFKKDSTHFQPLDSVRSKVEDMALQAVMYRRGADFSPNLRKSFKVQIVAVKRPETSRDSLLAYWKSNSERWSSAATFRLSALSGTDSAALTKAVAQATSLAAFRNLSAKFPIGSPKAPNGELGRVKVQYAIPYGIGMIPEVWEAVEQTKLGAASKTFRYNDTNFMSVWVESRDSGAVKPFNTVEAEVRRAYEESHPWIPSPNVALATWDKGTMFTRGDVNFISEEIPANLRRQFPAERVLDFMINWEINDRFAREAGLTSRESFQSATQDNKKVYWSQEFRSSRQAQMFYFTNEEANFAVNAWKTRLGPGVILDTLGANRDGARLSLLGANDLDEAYRIGIDRFWKDSVLTPVDSARKNLFYDLRSDLDARGRLRLDSVLKAKFQFQTQAGAPLPVHLSVTAAFDSARAHHDRRSLAKAEELYRQVEKDASASDSLRATALFQLGQLFGEQQYYYKSLEAYRSVLVRFPKSGEAYKAQFMIAFTLSEFLKTEKRALVEYRKVIAEFPKCDLADDADWMIRNIESGGALMPKFDDSAFVADSIRRADSLSKSKASAPASKAETKKDTAKVKAAPAVAPAAKVEPKKDTAKVKAAPVVAPAAKVEPKKDTAKVKAAPVVAPAAKVEPKKDTAKAKAAPVVVPAAKVEPKKDTAKAKAAPVVAPAAKVEPKKDTVKAKATR